MVLSRYDLCVSVFVESMQFSVESFSVFIVVGGVMQIPHGVLVATW